MTVAIARDQRRRSRAAIFGAVADAVGPRLPALLTTLVLLLVWQLATMTGLWSSLYIVPPLDIARALGDMLLSGELMENVSVSLVRIAGGFVVGTTVGLAIGVALGWSRLLESMFLPILSALYPLPKLALLPLLVFWFGIGEQSKIALIALGSFFYVCLNAFTGVRLADPILIKAARNLGAGPRQLLLRVVLPGALPMIMTGVKLAGGYSLSLIVAAEMIAAQSGLGHLVLLAGQFLQMDRLMAGVVVFGILGVLVYVAMDLLERWLAPWRT